MMSHEVLSEENIRNAFEEYKSGIDIDEVARKNAVVPRSLYRYFAKRGLNKRNHIKLLKETVSDKQKKK